MTAAPADRRCHAALVDQRIDPTALLRAVADPGAGATALFLGTVRNAHEGRSVTGIDYHAYAAMAARHLAAIVAEAGQRYGTCAISAEHRVGHLALGEISVAIAASHERRAPAFAAARYVIEEIKRRLPIWKREHYADGTREWVDPVHDMQTAVSAHAGEAP
ncbi:MAG: molybdenum cofactor biosynthesis protein MoaE [Gemmatimonadales bacterium]|jgi:molybdopterin synthase catalytic subunit